MAAIKHQLLPIAVLSTCLLGCTATKFELSYFDSHTTSQIHNTQPVIEGSINGVKGKFLIDTGASGPFLFMTGARRCGISVAESHWNAVEASGATGQMMEATNVTIKLSKDVTVLWPVVLVLENRDNTETNQDFFGVIDYETLVLGHAVIDTTKKKLIFSK